MKKIIFGFVAWLIVISSFAQSSDAALTTQADVIRNETAAGGNTKVRIANMFQALIDSKVSLIKFPAPSTLGTSLQLLRVNSGGTGLEWYTPSFGLGDMLLGTAQTSTGKKTFTTDATNAGLNITSGSPSTLVDGDFWLNSSVLNFRAGSQTWVVAKQASGSSSQLAYFNGVDGSLNGSSVVTYNAVVGGLALGDGSTVGTISGYFNSGLNGQHLFIKGGDGGTTDKNGGNLSLTSGAPTGAGTEASVNVQSRSTGKLGFFGATAVVKQSAVTTAQGIADALTSYGLIPSSTISGGGGTPGGSDTQVQFNDSGSFGGDAGLLFNKTTNYLTVSGGLNSATTQSAIIRTVTFFGDSKTAGTGYAAGNIRWPTRVSQFMNFTEDNKGVSGQTMYLGMDGRTSEIPTYNASTAPYLFFSYSTNDIQGSPATYTTTNFATSYQTVLDAAYAKGWPTNKIYILMQTPDAGYAARVTSYNSVITGLPSAFVRNNGLNIIDVYSIYANANADRYFDGPHENYIGSEKTAAAVIAALPIQPVEENSQAGAFNGLIDAQTIRFKKNSFISPTSVSWLIAADQTGNIGLKRSEGVYINNSIEASAAQISDIWIDGSVTGRNGFFSGNGTGAILASGNGVHLYSFSNQGYLNANNAGVTSVIPMNYIASIHNYTGSIYGGGGVASTGLPSAVAAVRAALGTFGNVARLYGRSVADAAIPVAIGEGGSNVYLNGNTYVGAETNATSRLQTPSLATGYVAKTALYTLTISDYTVEVTSGTHTQTLPTAVGISGRIYFITNSGAGVVTVGTTSSQTFINVTATPTTLTLNQFQGVMVQSNGANWIKLSGF